MFATPQLWTPPPKKIVASSEESETTSWVNAVVADGGAVSTTQRTRVNTLIADLKSASAWTTIVRFWLYAGETDEHQAKIDIKNLSSHTLISTPAFNASGYKGNGSTHAIDTGYNPNTASLDGTTAIMGVYITGEDTTGSNPILFGQTGAGGGNYTMMRITGANADITFCLADGGFNTGVGDASGTAIALWTLFATGATNVSVARNGSVVESDTRSANSFESSTIYVLGFNNNGTLGGQSDSRAAAFFIGTDSTKRTSIETALNTYMTSWGINVY